MHFSLNQKHQLGNVRVGENIFLYCLMHAVQTQYGSMLGSKPFSETKCVWPFWRQHIDSCDFLEIRLGVVFCLETFLQNDFKETFKPNSTRARVCMCMHWMFFNHLIGSFFLSISVELCNSVDHIHFWCVKLSFFEPVFSDLGVWMDRWMVHGTFTTDSLNGKWCRHTH